MPMQAFFQCKPFAFLARNVMFALALAAGAAHADDYSEVNRLIGARQFPQALAQVDKYLASKPRDPQMRFLKSTVQSQTGNTSEAIATLTQITEDYPELPEPYNNLAVLYAGQGQLEKARTSLEMAIRINPRYAIAFENMGDVQARLASQAYSRAQQITPGNASLAPKLALIKQLLEPVPTPAATAPARKASSPQP